MAAKRTSNQSDSVHGASSGTVPVVEQGDVERSFLPIDGKLECTVTSQFKINYGYYEAHHVFAAAKATFDSQADPDKIAAYLDERVFSLMNPQLEAAQDVSIKESFGRKFEQG